MNAAGQVQLKAVYTIVERPNAKARWVRIGIGFVNHDGSVNVRLDAMPVNGTLHIRDHRRRGEGGLDAGDAPEDASAGQEGLSSWFGEEETR